MASFTVKPNGKVWVRVSQKKDGKFSQLSYTANSMEEAQLWAARMEAGQVMEREGGEAMTVLQLHHAYMLRTVSESTRSIDEYRIVRLLDYFGGVTKADGDAKRRAKWAALAPTDIKPNQVEEYLRQTHRSFNTLRRDIFHLRRLLRNGSFSHLDKVKIGNEKIKAKLLISEQEYQRLLSYALPQHRWIIRLLCESGWRRGEVFNLRPCDLHLGNVPVADFKDVKSGDPKVRYMTDACKEVLREVVSEHLALGRGRETRLCTFKSAHEITQMVRRTRQKAGLGEHIHPHAFRHLFITKAQGEFGLTAKDVMQFTGHEDVTTVMRYTQPDMKLALDRMRGGINGSVRTPEAPKTYKYDPNFFMK